MTQDEMTAAEYRELMGLEPAGEGTPVVTGLETFLEQSSAMQRLTEQAQQDAQKSARQRKRDSQKERYTDLLLGDLRMAGLPAPVREHRFHPVRRWRFDLCWINEGIKLAVEIDGGGYSNPIKCPRCGANTGHRAGGRHHRGIGYERDCEKLAEAASLGWTVIRVVPRQIKNGQALAWISALLVPSDERHE